MATKTKKVIIKEELVELTGDFKLAIVLNQMIYWSERIQDFDQFIKEEKERLANENLDSTNLEYQKGWIYKTAVDLAEECMITNSEATMRRYLNKLVEKGWLDTRNNPKYRWDKTIQYRVNLAKIQLDLWELGYALEGYKLPTDFPKNKNDRSNFQNESSSFQDESSNFQNESPNFHDERAIPEITTETTSESTSEILKEEVEEGASHSKVNPFQFFEQNGFGTIGGYISQKIKMWCNDLNDELVVKAMEIAVERGAKTFAYIESILRNWADKNITTVEQADALILKYKDQQSKQRSSPQQRKPIRTEKIPDFFGQQQQETNVAAEEDSQLLKDLEEEIKSLRSTTT